MSGFGQQRFWTSVTQSAVQATEQQLGDAAHTLATQGSEGLRGGPGVQTSWGWVVVVEVVVGVVVEDVVVEEVVVVGGRVVVVEDVVEEEVVVEDVVVDDVVEEVVVEDVVVE